MGQHSHDVFNDFLDALQVKHTHDYSLKRFESMSFKSLFGFTKLLGAYGIESEGLTISDKSEITKLTAPFLAQMKGAFVIVRSISAEEITYESEGRMFTLPVTEFCKNWTGTVILAFPTPQAIEPDYPKNRFLEIADKVKYWLLAGCAAFIFLYLFISDRMYQSVPLTLLTALDLVGLFVSWLLVLKSLNIHSSAADSMCGVIEREGCSTVLSTDASKFFGLFGWSEVGLAYFSVSLGCLLAFPQYIHYLAAINLCCLPFSFWSVWYQKFRAKAWCTLCLTVQATLWLEFFCYLGADSFHHIFPLRIQFFILGAAYVAVMLAINRISPHFDKTEES